MMRTPLTRADYDLCECGKPKRAVSRRCWACHSTAKRVPANQCPDCGKLISRTAARCKSCADIFRKRPRLQVNGYMLVQDKGHPLADPRGRVLLHRKVVHDAGIEIPKGHAVHHRNGDRTDNRLANLAVLPSSEHSRLHAWERGWVRNQFGIFEVSEHGLAAYSSGRCRCDICRKANTDYCRKQRAKRRERAATPAAREAAEA